MGHASQIQSRSTPTDERLFAELWISLASLLRSYTAVHGLSANRQAHVEHSEHEITACHGAKWLRLERNHTSVAWMRENGSSGEFELTEHGRVRSSTGEEELDLAAESWARELMHDHKAELAR